VRKAFLPYTQEGMCELRLPPLQVALICLAMEEHAHARARTLADFMGSFVELNDTLQITREQGFPADILNLEKHRKSPIKLASVPSVFEFHDKPGARLYHQAPTRCFLVQNIGGKWIYWGKIVVIEQTIKGESEETQTTSGKYRIIELYEPAYQEQITRHESPKGKSYF